MQEKNFLSHKVWAVVGASDNPQKFGNKIYRRLKEKDYEVYAINPGLEVLDGDPCYKNLTALPKVPDVIDMVVSPERGKAVLEEAAKLGVKNVWFQPGTYTDETLELAKTLGLNLVQSCVLIATQQST